MEIIKFTDFIKAPEPQKTKVKFNMNANDKKRPALDYLLNNKKSASK